MEVWTKGLPLLSARPPLPSSPRLIIHSRHGEPRESPLPSFSFFSFSFNPDRVRRAAKNSLRRARMVVLILSGGLFSSSAAVLSPPPPPPPSPSSFFPSTNCFFSINFVSWDAYRLHEQLDDCLPRYLFLAPSLANEAPSWPTLDCPPNRTWLLFLPKNWCTFDSRCEVGRASFLVSLDCGGINRIISGERDGERPAFVN